MWFEMLRDPRVRRAYVLAKVSVFAFAAAATWPLSLVVGDKAWIGLGVFGLILVVLTLAVFAAAGRPTVESGDEEDEEGDSDPSDPIVIPVEDHLDLHPFPPKDVPDVVSEYLREARAKGFLEVRLIHGKGIGVQRERVRSLLSRHPLVDSYRDAPPTRGGWGATIAYLTDTAD